MIVRLAPDYLAERSVQILFGQFVLWILEYFFCASFFDHFAEIHEDDMVGYAECLAQGMCHHHDAIVFLQFSEELFYLLLLIGSRAEVLSSARR